MQKSKLVAVIEAWRSGRVFGQFRPESKQIHLLETYLHDKADDAEIDYVEFLDSLGEDDKRFFNRETLTALQGSAFGIVSDGVGVTSLFQQWRTADASARDANALTLLGELPPDLKLRIMEFLNKESLARLRATATVFRFGAEEGEDSSSSSPVANPVLRALPCAPRDYKRLMSVQEMVIPSSDPHYPITPMAFTVFPDGLIAVAYPETNRLGFDSSVGLINLRERDSQSFQSSLPRTDKVLAMCQNSVLALINTPHPNAPLIMGDSSGCLRIRGGSDSAHHKDISFPNALEEAGHSNGNIMIRKLVLMSGKEEVLVITEEESTHRKVFHSYNLNTGVLEVDRFEAELGLWCSLVCLDNGHLAVVGADEKIRYYDPETGVKFDDESLSLKGRGLTLSGAEEQKRGFSDSVMAIERHPDGAFIFAYGFGFIIYHTWDDVVQNNRAGEYDVRVSDHIEGYNITAITFTRNRDILVGLQNGKVLLYSFPHAGQLKKSTVSDDVSTVTAANGAGLFAPGTKDTPLMTYLKKTPALVDVIPVLDEQLRAFEASVLSVKEMDDGATLLGQFIASMDQSAAASSRKDEADEPEVVGLIEAFSQLRSGLNANFGGSDSGSGAAAEAAAPAEQAAEVGLFFQAIQAYVQAQAAECGSAPALS